MQSKVLWQLRLGSCPKDANRTTVLPIFSSAPFCYVRLPPLYVQLLAITLTSMHLASDIVLYLFQITIITALEGARSQASVIAKSYEVDLKG
jgi:hypothetical protein